MSGKSLSGNEPGITTQRRITEAVTEAVGSAMSNIANSEEGRMTQEKEPTQERLDEIRKKNVQDSRQLFPPIAVVEERELLSYIDFLEKELADARKLLAAELPPQPHVET